MVQMQASVTSHRFDCRTLPVEVSISCFPGSNGVGEYHLMIRPTEYGNINTQMDWLIRAYQEALDSVGLDQCTCIFRRFFCSDLTNQVPVLQTYTFANAHTPDEPCAVSLVCQPPPPPAKVAIWAYHVSDSLTPIDKKLEDGSLLFKHGDLTHIWTTGVTSTDGDTSYAQTEDLFRIYETFLETRELCLTDHVIRTWLFVPNIDGDYHEMVKARKDIFTKWGLTPDTHFIASTGIGGASDDVAAKVIMDAYAISGVCTDQIQFLSAPDRLSPTHVYGVTFERGVCVAYKDRKHVLVSGTASIDHTGRIVHNGNVLRQLNHTLENVEALLQDAGATFRDVCAFIVYVRDPSDVDILRQVMWERFGSTPIMVVVANVCRPGWLVEVECQAIVPTDNPVFPSF